VCDDVLDWRHDSQAVDWKIPPVLAQGRSEDRAPFATRAAAEKHERAVQYFKRH
jgi:hypothetical protein